MQPRAAPSYIKAENVTSVPSAFQKILKKKERYSVLRNEIVQKE